MLICRSRKTTESAGSSNSHLSFPNEFICSLNWRSEFGLELTFGVEDVEDVVGFQIQITSSINRR